MSKAKVRLLWLGLAVCMLSCLGLFVNFLGHEDDHKTNFRYLTWKYGRAPQDYRWCLHLMLVDEGLREKMKGKPMEQLRQWLPETGPAKPGTWQADWLENMHPDPGVRYEQIGTSSIAIQLRNDKFENIFPMKG